MNKGLNAYHQVGVKDQVASAEPHKIIQMLMQGAIDRLAQARGCIERKEYQAKGAHLARAVGIVNALRDSLKPVPGAEELTTNLNDLYVFILEQINKASVTNEAQPLIDSADIMQTIKEGWDAIPQAARDEAYQQQAQMQSASGY